MKDRIPRHVGFIPDGNRRWAERRGLSRRAGYQAGIEPGLRLLDLCRQLGIAEVSIYGFTKENVHRPGDQVEAFQEACAEFGLRAVEAGAALRAVGDTTSPLFPDALRRFGERRSGGQIRVNLLVNYGWQWDLMSALKRSRPNGRLSRAGATRALGSRDVSRIDLVVRWGGRRRLSGFLPMQSAYADLCVIDSLWPDMLPEEFMGALQWYQEQDDTMGG